MKKLILLLALLFSFLANAQKAITVTTELKAANTKLFKNYTVGSIRSGASVPHTFSGVTANYARTDGYHTLPASIWIADGFRDWVTPSFDVSIERLGAIFYDSGSDTFTYPIIALTQQEQDAFQQQILDSDNSQQLADKRIADGIEKYRRLQAIIIRKHAANEFHATPATNTAIALGLMEYFSDSVSMINFGDWTVAKSKLLTAPVTSNAVALDLYNQVKDGVDAYVANNF